jgi:hypothetical protein
MWSLPNGSGEQPPAKEQVKGIARLIPTFINTIDPKQTKPCDPDAAALTGNPLVPFGSLDR